jgi:UDP-N-acetylmuramoyl-L-alanyl-D-glutamate--2,6-diaminopimelate ligase
LVAGKGHEAYQLVGERVLDFDDVAVVRDALEHRE